MPRDIYAAPLQVGRHPTKGVEVEQMEIGVCHKLELRQEGGKLYAEGPLVVYGDRAKLGAGRTEVFMPGSMAVAEFQLVTHANFHLLHFNPLCGMPPHFKRGRVYVARHN